MPDDQSASILPHRNISCRASELAQYFRTMNQCGSPLCRLPWQQMQDLCMRDHIVVGPSKNSHFAISDAILY
jgi:hypothetical protein